MLPGQSTSLLYSCTSVAEQYACNWLQDTNSVRAYTTYKTHTRCCISPARVHTRSHTVLYVVVLGSRDVTSALNTVNTTNSTLHEREVSLTWLGASQRVHWHCLDCYTHTHTHTRQVEPLFEKLNYFLWFRAVYFTVHLSDSILALEFI